MPASLLLSLLLAPGWAQRELAGSAEIHHRLQRLNNLGRVLMIAAHPDDENTNLLAWFARGRHYRTGYLSLTRGEGGQNLIGAEQGDAMGVIRTQELLAARRIDGAEQFFSRATDFGFSKTADETLAKWGREAVLSDAVWVIRRFRPDVVVFRFSGTPRDGHGHHQSSALLGKEAIAAAADANRFPEQLKYVKAHQTTRAFFNLFAFNEQMERENAKIPNTVAVDAGVFDPVLGFSYGEIAGMSRSRHSSQAMGAPERRGAIVDRLALVAGSPASGDPFDGIDTTWNRVPGGAEIGKTLSVAIAQFAPSHPERTVTALLSARKLIAALNHPAAEGKLQELDELIAECAGLWLDATADRHSYAPGGTARITLTAVNRLGLPVTLTQNGRQPLPANQPWTANIEWKIPADAPLSQPFWLARPKQGTLYDVADRMRIGDADNAPEKTVEFPLEIEGRQIRVRRPVIHRYVDPARGELTRAVRIVPAVAVEFTESAIVFPDAKPRAVQVEVKASQPNQSGSIRLRTAAGWKVEPASQVYSLKAAGEQTTLRFEVTPPAADSVAMLSGEGYGIRDIVYPHIPPQTLFPPAEVKLVRAGIRTLSRNAGYVMGAGDEVPAALRGLGIAVSLLSDDDLAKEDLSRYDAIIAGVRAYNTRPALRANHQRLLDYMTNGGTYVVQYNVVEGFPGRERRDTIERIGPYPITLDRARVTVEEAPMRFPNPDHLLLRAPNRITEKDFEGWVQERGLYFASKYDPKYESVFASHDPNEDWLPGGMLYTRYGKGAYVFTGYAWFRQLPAGVPGAYRIFANLISAAKAAQ